MSDRWTLADIPDHAGRTVVVTGPSVGGLGHYIALELARRGARVVLAGRTMAKLDATAAAISGEVPGAALEQLRVDLADLASVRAGAGAAAGFGPIDVLVNNAGVMAPPLSRTVDGFELQMATNHFGPFLLTGLLLPQLVASGHGRVVTVSSNGHRLARSAPLGDPLSTPRHYQRWAQYGATKLANLLFTYELDRRLRAASLPARALAAHPGLAGTHLVANGRFGRASGGIASIFDAATKAVSQSASDGALPVLMAATADLPGSTYCGPAGRSQWRGPPQVVGSSDLAHDSAAQRAFWKLSADAVGLDYP